MDSISNYRVLSILGNQAKRKFCEVYLVEQISTGEQCVLKRLKKSESNQHIVDRLKSEAQFDFPNSSYLPSTIAEFDTVEEYSLLRTYTQGIPIATFSKQLSTKNRHLFLQQVPRLFSPILEELARSQVVHLDIKPSNVLVSKSDSGEIQLKLIDFGLSMRLGEIQARKTLFPLGYAAPELLLNRLHLVNHSTDYFSIGCLLWHLFTEKFPLSHPNPSVITNLQITHPLPESDGITKKQLVLLNQLAGKHQFKLPPNKYSVEQLDELLIEGMNSRPTDFKAFCDDWEKSFEKKKWWVF